MPLYFAVDFNNMTRTLVGEKTITELCCGIDCTFRTESTSLQQTRITVGISFYLNLKTMEEGISTRGQEYVRSIKHLRVILFLYFIEIDNPRMIKLIQY